jgi:hypothetical protein
MRPCVLDERQLVNVRLPIVAVRYKPGVIAVAGPQRRETVLR